MVFKLKIIIVPILIISAGFIISCNDSGDNNKNLASAVISKNISQPASAKAKKEKNIKQSSKPDTIDQTKLQIEKKAADYELKKTGEVVKPVAEHYNSKGKTDPFIPLIQEKTEVVYPPGHKPEPERILTPLEKIELSQIRLVAVIVMQNRRIAMVEEASGKGYEVGVGTYIGKQNGKITQIKDSSIVIKEPVRDFKGRLSERVQEIKLQKNDIGD